MNNKFIDRQLAEFKKAINDNDNKLLKKWCFKAINSNNLLAKYDAHKTNIKEVGDCVNLAKCYNDSKFMRSPKFNLIDFKTFLDESLRNFEKVHKLQDGEVTLEILGRDKLIDALKMNIKNKKSSGTYCSNRGALEEIIKILSKPIEKSEGMKGEESSIGHDQTIPTSHKKNEVVNKSITKSRSRSRSRSRGRSTGSRDSRGSRSRGSRSRGSRSRGSRSIGSKSRNSRSRGSRSKGRKSRGGRTLKKKKY